jgi:O-antigen/teichoic acid export membrane protein
MCNCTSRNLEIPGSLISFAPRNDGVEARIQPNLNGSLINRAVAAGLRPSLRILFAVAVMDAEPVTAPAGLIARLRARLTGGSSEASVTRRLAGTIFVIRVVSAGLAYLSQILLARWMGGSDYGIYVYVWTWVLLLGSMMDFGISASAQKIIPEYRASGNRALLRGFLSGSRWMTFAVSGLVSLLLAGLVKLLSPFIEAGAIVPLYIGCMTLPPFVVANTQDGIARSHDWMRLGLMPQFIVRQGLIIGFTAGAFALGFHLGAAVAMAASAAAVWIAMIGQLILLNRRLAGHVEPGAKAYDFRGWLAISLPILLVESFYLLLSYTDVLVLQQFRPSEEVGVYFAVVKTLALVSFIHYAMSATTAHRFAEYHALGDKARLSAYVAHAIAWTFWPSLAATVALLAFGKPLLWLFGPQFVIGYDIMFIAAIGLVVRSAIGPVERLLNMLGHQHICALTYALAFVINVALCVALVPRFGGHGAAAATSLSLVFETVLLFWIVRRRLGLHVLAFGK